MELLCWDTGTQPGQQPHTSTKNTQHTTLIHKIHISHHILAQNYNRRQKNYDTAILKNITHYSKHAKHTLYNYTAIQKNVQENILFQHILPENSNLQQKNITNSLTNVASSLTIQSREVER